MYLFFECLLLVVTIVSLSLYFIIQALKQHVLVGRVDGGRLHEVVPFHTGFMVSRQSNISVRRYQCEMLQESSSLQKPSILSRISCLQQPPSQYRPIHREP